ncbi:YitT family protein [Olsenella sp. HMSC062G07]|uniref:YitT family protein n=1 Tax=Olsenella sp. HMSC062G07 TaxID=1739330 RepID=UPI0008A16839|nr:YitT family protein [Olsenella sp. HMSC062G07]OFK24965.1 hypothetical protein HMPREF2826_03270 [Olsenella sp. HMSC062G07]
MPRPFLPLPRVSRRELARKLFLILAGSFIYALGVDMFEIPNGLAAGGLTGLATTTSAVAAQMGVNLPVGIQTIGMNALLLIYVYVSTKDVSYIMQSIVGILASGFFTDALAPLVPVPAQGQLLICAIWGGVISGAGIGLVFMSGGNTGGTDLICQLIARRTGSSMGVLVMLVDGSVLLLSVPVFSLTNALYAGVAMYVAARVLDMVLEGPLTARVCYVISELHADIAREVLYTLGRGCTELQARGVWSGNARPVLMVVVGRNETVRLKEIVASLDPEAIVIVSEVHEAFGEGFSRLGSS